MRIAVWHNLGAGGAKRHLYQHVKGLTAAGHRVEAWCPISADADYLPLSELVEEHRVPLEGWPSALYQCGIETAAFARHTSTILSRMDRSCRAAAAQINAGRFDVLLGTTCRFTGISSIALWVKAPSVLYLHELCRFLHEALPELPWAALRERGVKARIKDILRVRAFRIRIGAEGDHSRAFNRVLVNSCFTRENLLRAHGADSQVCYQGVDLDVFQWRNLAREPFILGVGSFALHKNIPFAINAVAAIPEPRPRLVWIGNGGSRSYAEDLKRGAEKAGVVFEPRFGVTDAELVDHYNRASALIYAPRLEPFGLAPLEAGACGLPVVSTAEGGMRETIVDTVNGLVVDPSCRAVGQALARLLTDRDWAAQLGERARRWVREKWSLKDSVMRLERFLASTAGAAAAI